MRPSYGITNTSRVRLIGKRLPGKDKFIDLGCQVRNSTFFSSGQKTILPGSTQLDTGAS
jgi:hypothetical protein